MTRLRCLFAAMSLCALPIAVGAQSAPAGESPADGSAPATLSFSAGVKLWSNTWDSWVTSRTGTGVALGTLRYQTVQAVNSDAKLSAIPFISARYGDYVGSLSMMARTRYSLLDSATPGGFEVSASREEADLNLGYFVLPGFALTAGYKRMTQIYGPDSYRWRGPILGASGSASLSGGWAVYGSVGIGFMKASFPGSQADAYGRTGFDADYRLGEFGLAYGLAPDFAWLRSAVATIGYRLQNVSTKGYGLAVTDPLGAFTPNTSTRLKDTTQGLVFSVNLAF